MNIIQRIKDDANFGLTSKNKLKEEERLFWRTQHETFERLGQCATNTLELNKAEIFHFLVFDL